MGKTPLVMFYPGRYDGQALRLFGKLQERQLLPGLQAGSVSRGAMQIKNLFRT